MTIPNSKLPSNENMYNLSVEDFCYSRYLSA